MKYRIRFFCRSHIGMCRSINQDNCICNKHIMDETEAQTNYSLDGILECGDQSLLGVFDGMGGEECGEIASLIAARSAKEFIERESISEDLNELCNIANEKICQFADQHNIVAMGTTAALLLFGEKDISLCNIGDSKIFRFADEQFEQISVDHIAIGLHGCKPPLLQNLGISSSEMIIEPYLATGDYNDGDIYLICSDGLTDMVTEKEIKSIIMKNSFDEATEILLNTALSNGGKDNITIILCRIEKKRLLGNLFKH